MARQQPSSAIADINATALLSLRPRWARGSGCGNTHSMWGLGV
eukprot:CAMPEP_0180508200 /NCGR_PEP_ID=MMETSP1036_2-20121128/49032_1 /TAXON_ID=632150 /ORGANISM="Azadinium spinosum, Strain 3D9" /LENGTH=42 /DNA_ID= /DNA_START= /DNA_END= /DNA_ORIENTATION=